MAPEAKKPSTPSPDVQAPPTERADRRPMLDPISLSVGAIGLGITTLFAPFAVHRVPEGHVAVYYRGGALLDRISGPGFHMLTPVRARELSWARVCARVCANVHGRAAQMLEHVHYVQTTVQTDKACSAMHALRPARPAAAVMPGVAGDRHPVWYIRRHGHSVRPDRGRQPAQARDGARHGEFTAE